MWTLPRVPFSASTPGGEGSEKHNAHTLRRSTFEAGSVWAFLRAPFSDKILGTGSFSPHHNSLAQKCVGQLWLFRASAPRCYHFEHNA